MCGLSMTEPWYIAYCSNDKQAAEGLANREFEVFRPVLPWQRRRLGKPDIDGRRRCNGAPIKGISEKSMFPGYVLVQLSGHTLEELGDVPGLTYLLEVDGKLATFDEDFVAAITQKQTDAWARFKEKPATPKLQTTLKAGDKIWINEGLWRGLATIEKLDDDGRAHWFMNRFNVPVRGHTDLPLTA
jgi:transcription antitermination factor NusG